MTVKEMGPAPATGRVFHSWQGKMIPIFGDVGGLKNHSLEYTNCGHKAFRDFQPGEGYQ